MIIDTHAHLNMNEFENDLGDVVKRAAAADVGVILDVATDLKSSRKAVKNSKKYREIYAAVGFHPHEAVNVKEEDWVELEKLLMHPNVVAVGEIGLDYHYDFSPRDIQREVFLRQLKLAKKRDLPVIIHIREAMKDGLSVFDRCGDLKGRGVFHCFGGEETDVRKVLERGFYISFTGVVTFKNYTKKNIVRIVPIGRILLETDAPFMAPVPMRGKRNEPGFIVHTAQRIAETMGVTYGTISVATTVNAEALFGKFEV